MDINELFKKDKRESAVDIVAARIPARITPAAMAAITP